MEEDADVLLRLMVRQFRTEPFGDARGLGRPGAGPKWWENAVDGDIYRTMILAYHEGNTGLPIFMGENSIAYEQPRA